MLCWKIMYSKCYAGAVHAVLEVSCLCCVGGKLFKLSKWKFFLLCLSTPFSRTTVHAHCASMLNRRILKNKSEEHSKRVFEALFIVPFSNHIEGAWIVC